MEGLAFRWTPAMREAFALAAELGLSSEVPTAKDGMKEVREQVSLREIRRVYAYLRENQERWSSSTRQLVHLPRTLREWTLHRLLKGSRILAKQEHGRAPEKVSLAGRELRRLLASAQEELDRREYERMVSGVAVPLPREGKGHQPGQEESWSEIIRTVNAQLTVIVNILFSMVAVFTALFYCGEGVAQGNLGWRILLALAGAVIVGAAESYLFYIRTYYYPDLHSHDTATKLASFTVRKVRGETRPKQD